MTDNDLPVACVQISKDFTITPTFCSCQVSFDRVDAFNGQVTLLCDCLLLLMYRWAFCLCSIRHHSNDSFFDFEAGFVNICCCSDDTVTGLDPKQRPPSWFIRNLNLFSLVAVALHMGECSDRVFQRTITDESC